MSKVLADVNTPVIPGWDVMQNMDESTGKRLREARKLRGLTQTKLAHLAKVSQGTIGNIESGSRGYGGSIIQISEVLNVNPHWLLTGEGDMNAKNYLFAVEGSDTAQIVGQNQKFEGTPVAATEGDQAPPPGMLFIRESQVRFSAGNGRTPVFDEIQESVPRSYSLDWFVKEGMNPENCRRFKVDGDSMEPFLYDNDKVLVNLAETNVINGKVYALRYGDELRIKRVYRKIDGGLILHSDNPEFRPRDEEISPEIVSQHISIIGRVRDKSGTGGL